MLRKHNSDQVKLVEEAIEALGLLLEDRSQSGPVRDCVMAVVGRLRELRSQLGAERPFLERTDLYELIRLVADIAIAAKQLF